MKARGDVGTLFKVKHGRLKSSCGPFFDNQAFIWISSGSTLVVTDIPSVVVIRFKMPVENATYQKMLAANL